MADINTGRLPDDLMERLKVIVARKDAEAQAKLGIKANRPLITQQAIIEAAIRQYVEREEGKP